MLNGLYVHKASEDDYMDIGSYLICRVEETEKSITLELIENTFRYLNGNLEMLLKEGKARINKSRSPHAMRFYQDGFVIYPYRNGIPFYFERWEE